MRISNVKRISNDNDEVTYPAVGSLHRAVVETNWHPEWSYSTFINILLCMGIIFKDKSEADKSILIED